MGDHVVLRFPFNDPDKPEVVDVLANVPVDWEKYLKKIADKEGRYIPANILYDKDYYHPESMEKIYKRTERDSE